MDGQCFAMVRDLDGSDMVFAGNTDYSGTIVNELPRSQVARFIRLIVVEYQLWPSVKWEVNGCPMG